uniref:DUF223 domain-containing protein n=2 Tax=Brassica campestris TaxID=3711 RepID=M4E8P0_BRACM
MASSSAPVANAAVAYSTFETLRLGRTGQSVVGRLIRFWDSRNINKNGEFMGITILLLDELDLVIHGFIPANGASHYRPNLKPCSMVKLDRSEASGSDLKNNAATTRVVVCLLIEPVRTVKRRISHVALEELTGREFVFQIGNTPFYFTPNHRTFTVSTITEATILENPGKDGEDILPGSEGAVGLAALSSGPTVLGDKLGEECTAADPPEVSGAENKLKRPR